MCVCTGIEWPNVVTVTTSLEHETAIWSAPSDPRQSVGENQVLQSSSQSVQCLGQTVVGCWLLRLLGNTTARTLCMSVRPLWKINWAPSPESIPFSQIDVDDTKHSNWPLRNKTPTSRWSRRGRSIASPHALHFSLSLSLTCSPTSALVPYFNCSVSLSLFTAHGAGRTGSALCPVRTGRR